MIFVDHLSKSFGSVQAVREISFSVEAGSIFAFLGTNGAGKSTTIACITTVLGFDSGSIQVDGKKVGPDDDAIRRSIGVVFQQSVLDPTLTVRENLASRAAFYGLNRIERDSRIAELSVLVGLETFLDRRYGQLSGGQKRRADIARSLVHDPTLLFLDEPTAGLDPQSREQVWETIHSLRTDHGLTVFLTTHYMEETERADQVSIIDSGQMVVQGTPAELRRRYSSSILTVTPSDAEASATLCRRAGIDPIAAAGRIGIAVGSAHEALGILEEHRSRIADFEFRHGTMDDVFLALTTTGAAA